MTTEEKGLPLAIGFKVCYNSLVHQLDKQCRVVREKQHHIFTKIRNIWWVITSTMRNKKFERNVLLLQYASSSSYSQLS
jgi:hypothetical protein